MHNNIWFIGASDRNQQEQISKRKDHLMWSRIDKLRLEEREKSSILTFETMTLGPFCLILKPHGGPPRKTKWMMTYPSVMNEQLAVTSRNGVPDDVHRQNWDEENVMLFCCSGCMDQRTRTRRQKRVLLLQMIIRCSDHPFFRWSSSTPSLPHEAPSDYPNISAGGAEERCGAWEEEKGEFPLE